MPWERTSASQHDAFLRCQRYWYFGWIDKIERPTTPAMQRGKDIHAEIEHYLLTGEVRDSSYTEDKLNYRPYVEALISYLPPPQHEELIVEHPIEVECDEGLAQWIGFIDLGFSAIEPLRLRDIKTTSDFRYAKTPTELTENVQLLSYAKWVYVATQYDGPIDIGHLYLKAEKRHVPQKPKVKLVKTTVSREHVERFWNSQMETVRQMKQASQVASAQDLPPTISACGMYGGCPFRSECSPKVSLIDLFRARGETQMSNSSFFQRFKAKQDSPTNAEPEGPKEPKEENKFLTKLQKKKEDPGILPPDAPSRETPKLKEEAEPEQKTEEKPKRKRGRPKKQEPMIGDEPIAISEEAPPARGLGTSKKQFVLYIDCMPVKDTDSEGLEPTLFEDWFGPLAERMDEHARSERDVPTYMLLPYSEEKAMVIAAVKDAISTLPPAMIMSSQTPRAKDALEVLTTHATRVVRAFR